MRERVNYTLGQAAKAVGMSKTYILRSIKAGRISAGRDELGQWAIEPCELHRVYPPLPDENDTGNGTGERAVTGGDTALVEANARVSLLEQWLGDLRTMLDDMRGQRVGGRPLSWWKRVSWKKETVTCGPEELSTKSRAIVDSTIKEVGKLPADDVTRKRFKRAMDYILDEGAFPGVLVAMKAPSGLEILDGNHRMSAFCGAQLMPDAAFERLQKKRPQLEQELWIGSHADAEIPLT
jgi:hypothetical protein